MSRRTPFAGLLQLDPGESISTENFGLYANVAIEDAYLQAMLNHRHDGHAAMAAFATGPTSSTSASGGLLTEGQTWYYGVTAVDQYGGETIATTGSATLPGALTNPASAPGVASISDGLGTLTAGTYRYAYTTTTASGESLISPVTNVAAQTNGKVMISIPGPSGSFRLYRAYGYAPLSRVGDTMVGSGFLDDGRTSVYCSQQPPNQNTTGSQSSLTVTRPATMPSGAVGWRAYFSRYPTFDSPALWSPDAGATLTLPVASGYAVLTDAGQLVNGEPPLTSHTIPGASLLYATDVIYAGSGGVGSGSVETALNALATAGFVNSIGPAGSATINGVVSLVGSGYTSVTSSGSSIIITSSGGVSSIAASGASAITGPVTIQGINGIVVTQGPDAITISASGFGAASGVSYVNTDGSSLMTGPLRVAHGSAGVIVTSSGATHAFELWKSTADSAPRIKIDHDGTSGRIVFSDGSTGLLHTASMMFDTSGYGIYFPDAYGISSHGDIKTEGSFATTGLSGALTLRSALGCVEWDRMYQTGYPIMKAMVDGNAQHRWSVLAGGQIGWSDGTIASENTPMVSLGYQSLGNDTLVVDSAITGSGGKLVHGRWSEVIASATTLASGDITYVNNSGGAITATLPASPKPGTHRTIKARSNTTNNVTIGRNGNNIEGAGADYVMSGGTKESVSLHYPGDGSGWWIVGKYA